MKAPISLIIDDPAPVISVYKEHSPDPFTKDGRPLVPTYPNELLFAFCNVVQKHGIRGKFSIVPMPANKGDIRYGIKGVSKAEMQEWLDTVKSKLTPAFTIGPEMLTHHKAIELDSGMPLEMSEKEWATTQNKDTLTPYIAKALSILNEVGFDAFGVTSPWDFGITVEDEYVAAIADAVFSVTGKRASWYFLRYLRHTPNAKPWVAYDKEQKTVVSIPATVKDYFWQTIDTTECSDEYISRIADGLITADGKSGEILQVLNSGGYPIIVTHWQSLMSNGLGTGIKALERVAERVAAHLADRVEWQSFAQILEAVVKDKASFPMPQFHS